MSSPAFVRGIGPATTGNNLSEEAGRRGRTRPAHPMTARSNRTARPKTCAMWRSSAQRRASARERLRLAKDLWGWKPHRRQKAFFVSPAQVRVAACGRRWGKTEALAVDLATLALAEAAAGRDCRQLVVAPSEAQARLIGGETLRLLRDAFDQETPHTHGPRPLTLTVQQRPGLQVTVCPPEVNAKPSHSKLSNSKKAKGRGPAVSRLLFRTAGRDGRGLRGLWAHRIVADEAAYVPDAVISEVLLPMLTDVGGELTLASSPAGRRNVFYRLFAQGEAAGPPSPTPVSYGSFQCPSADNPHLNRGFLAAMQEELGESRFAVEYGAEFRDDYGAVFGADDIDACLAADPAVSLVDGNLVSAPVPGHWYTVGVDWGRKQDFTVVCVLDVTEAPARLVGLWRRQGTGWEAQAAVVGQWVARFRPRRVLADGNGVGDPVAERLQAEIRARVGDGERAVPVERFLFAGETKTALVDRLTLGLSARALTYPPHRALLRELRGFEYGEATASGRARMAAAGGGHDDIVMALALAWYAAPEGTAPPPSRLLLLGSQAGLERRAGWA